MSAKPLILERLKEIGKFSAVHELHIYGYSENCIATRLPEMVKDGLVVGRYREGENFKEWGLPEWVKLNDLKGSGRGGGCVSSPSKPIQGELVWKDYEPRIKEAIETPLERLVGGW